MRLLKLSRKIKKWLVPGPVMLSDEYIDRLLCSNAGMLHRGNIHCFDYAIRHLPSSNPLLEIGSFCGLSANLITYLLDKNQRTNELITCDCWTYEGVRDEDSFEGKEDYLKSVGDRADLSREVYTSFVKDSFIRNIKMFSRRRMPHAVDLTSDAFFSRWSMGMEMTDLFGRGFTMGGKISFCYIDGNHAYDFARRDFENTHQFLDMGGYILLDDSEDGLPYGSASLAKELRYDHRYELVMKNPNYLFRKKAES